MKIIPILAIVALAGCATAPSAPTVTTDIQTIDAGVAALPPLLTAAGVNIPAATMTQINAVIADIGTQASSVATAVTTPVNSAEAVEADITELAALVDPLLTSAQAAKAAPITALVEAAVSLGSVLLTEAGVVTAPTASAMPNTMSPAQARGVLHAAAVAR